VIAEWIDQERNEEKQMKRIEKVEAFAYLCELTL
jgi:hypothetical protein